MGCGSSSDCGGCPSQSSGCGGGAPQMARKGYKVGILDADITGPSIPKIFGIKEKAYADEIGMYPVKSKGGIDVMSVNLLLENDTDPVLWRGPILGNVVKQFYSDVIWKDIDYLFVDMPPGTGDVAITVYQSLKLDGIIIVTSPQDLVSMIVEKAVKMADLMQVPIIGVVENYSYCQLIQLLQIFATKVILSLSKKQT